MIRTPVREIVRAVDDAATEWSDSRSTRRADARAAVAARTGYSLAAVEYAFDRLFGTLRRDALESIITEELGALDALDGFAELAARPRARALPIGRVCIVSSRTTIGVALIPAIFALCAKCDVHVKDREDGLVAAFFASLSERLPALGGAFTARAWTSAEESGDLGSFDAVVAFGSDATIAAVASGLPPSTRFLPFGSKASAGYVTRESLTTPAAAAAIARGAATDLVLYDTEGCLSLHALFVEEGGDVTADAFAHLLAEAIEDAGSGSHRPVSIRFRRRNARWRATSRSSAMLAKSIAAREVGFWPYSMRRSTNFRCCCRVRSASVASMRRRRQPRTYAITASRSKRWRSPGRGRT